LKLFHFGKDGGHDSTVWGFWLIEIKSLFSVALLVFEDGSRDAFHSHAFNSVSWVLRGALAEWHLAGQVNTHRGSLKPVVTKRNTFHKVVSHGRTYVLTFRGPWAQTWREWLPRERRFRTLISGRKEI
jgi:hypothetical protein